MIAEDIDRKDAAPDRVTLRIAATSDLHLNLHPFDYFADRPAAGIGLAALAPQIEAARAGADACLLLDNGDILQGNPMGDFIAYERGLAADRPHPAIAALNALGYDAIALGNHDFDYGLDFLLAAMSAATFPVLAANVATELGPVPTGDRVLTQPFAILDRRVTDSAGRRRDLRVGLLGLAPPQIPRWAGRQLERRIFTRDIVQAARSWIPTIRAAGADVVIALCHSGIGAATAEAGMENAATVLGDVPGLDAIVAGHTHMVFPGPEFAGWPGVDADRGTLHGTPAVMPGLWGSHLGVIDLTLEECAGAWHVVGHRSEAQPALRTGPTGDSHAVLRATARDHVETLTYIRRPVGWTDQPLHSYFAFIGEDSALRVVNAAQRSHVTSKLAGTRHDGVAVLSAAAPFKAGGYGGPHHYTDIPAGELRMRNIADLYLFPNRLQAVRITGADLHAWLERSASLFLPIRPGARDAPLVNPDFPSHDFDVISGDLTYTIDPTAPARFDLEGRIVDAAARRVRDIRHRGRPVCADDAFILATNSFRIAGGGHLPRLSPDRVVLDAPDTVRDVILGHVRDAGTVRPEPAGGWRLALPTDTSVIFDTGPGSAQHVDRLCDVALDLVGPTEGGFLRYRLHGQDDRAP